jgi:benzodiazapine receptor
MKIKPNYIVIPAVAIATACLGSFIVASNLEWYSDVLLKPNYIPIDWVFLLVWPLIFVCTTLSALILWNKKPEKKLMLVYVLNAILNLVWLLFFLELHWIELALIEMFFLEITLIVMIMISWDSSKLASCLLIPYAAWVAFATYLTYAVLELNM